MSGAGGVTLERGLALFRTMARIRIESTIVWCAWLVLAMLATLLLLTFVPEIVLFVPRWLGYL